MAKVKVIFEAGLNHNGDSELAHKLVEAAALSGADSVKFQKRDIPSLATTAMLESEETRFPSLGSTYKQVRTKLELSQATYKSLKNQAHQLGLEFMVTPFDLASLEFILEIGVDSIKIASHSVANPRLLKAISETGLPIYMSSGMVTLEELDEAVQIFADVKDLTLLHCSSEYPTSDAGANLLLIPKLRARYRRPIGFSSHELGDLHSLSAVALGATCLERHVTLDNNLEGFDHKMSMDVESFAQLVEKVRRLEIALGDGQKRITAQEQLTRDKYRVSMVAARDLREGQPITPDMVVYKNPGTGIPASLETRVIGLKLRRDVSADSLLQEADIEGLSSQ